MSHDIATALWATLLAICVLLFAGTLYGQRNRAEHDARFAVFLDGEKAGEVRGTVLASGDVYQLDVGSGHCELRMYWDSDVGHSLELLCTIPPLTRIVRGTPWLVSATIGRHTVEARVIVDDD